MASLKGMVIYLGLATSIGFLHAKTDLLLSVLWGRDEIAKFYLFAAVPVLSFCAIVVYWRDKKKAIAGEWRTPETTLLNFAAAGGWPGALWAIKKLRHKSSKTRFLVALGCAVILNVTFVFVLIDCAARPRFIGPIF